MSGAEVLTFGCRLNLHESDRIAALAGHLDDTAIVNTCAVTAAAERQARQAIRKLHRASPATRIVVTGCAAQIAPARWAALPGVARIVGNGEKLRPETWAAGEGTGETAGKRAALPALTDAPPATPVVEHGSHIRALLQVQQGCDHGCTFCIIPQGRGPSRSVPVEAVIANAQSLVAAGHAEIVLTGVDIASWGHDLPGRPRLGTLCRSILDAVPGLARLRLSSLDPAAILPESDPDFWAVLAGESRFAPHLHLSLQAASDLVLKRMKRRHSRAQAGELIARARAVRPDIGIGADLIAGFPTETDEQAAETLDFVRAYRIAYLHVFPYSERPGTPAARMPSVPNALRRSRAAALREAGEEMRDAFWRGLIGRDLDVLMEGEGTGRSAQFALLRVRGAPVRRGVRLTLRPIALDGGVLLAETA
ncbi:MiaB/RimO family radical SAM methylthiotransferase [Acidomonas methanolica]|uniref:MiaB/RimO family radical SAM methylthiotransferase n=1 Tax=Acidomonas methanolica TaxID=437 RepID=UPI002119B8D2|nr:MiaB/RimO family radical SAM methylthiotransferase [Acidomonas methanolica]MCQ9156538.1 MiaB/RimO family radical SAM methylthiotransferase [Acidomonas methanolica]